jgi:hypothetical protein
MKNNKGSTEVLGALIILVLVIVAGLAIYFYNLKPIAEGESNIESIKSWLWTTAAKKKVTLGSAPSDRPPISYLSEPYNVESEDQLKKEVVPIIADSVYDCAKAFQFGEINFLTNIKSQGVFCFPCRGIKFSEELKSKELRLIGLKEYLETTKPIAGSGTYMEIFKEKATKNNFAVLNEQYEDNSIPINNNLYIYFMATDKKLSILEGAAVGAISGAGIGLLAGPFTSAIGAVGGAIGGGLTTAIYNWWYSDDKFKTWIYIASPEMINKVCNAKPVEKSKTNLQQI